MKKNYFLLILVIIGFSCNKKGRGLNNFKSVTIESLIEDTISCRAITIHDSNLWFAGSNGKYGSIDLESNAIFRGRVQKDSLFPEFRSIAATKDAVFIMSVANPALLYKISKDKKVTQLVYLEEHEKVFFDSMQFLDDEFGMAMGDPINQCFTIIVTEDGGNNWKKISCTNLPSLEDGEAAFAASNSNLILKKNKIFMVSGGTKARCFVSDDKGLTWKVYATPILQGEAMTGIFTADFYDEHIGIISGGNYENQEDNSTNKAITLDGGKTWQIVSKNEGFGYASCVQFVPNGRGKEIVSVGGTGIYFSNNRGKTWDKLDDTKDLFTLRFYNDSVAYAAGHNKIVRLVFK